MIDAFPALPILAGILAAFLIAGTVKGSLGVGLVAGTFSASLLNGTTATLSLICCAVALAGFRVGAWVRQRLTDRMFRLILLWLILAMGVRLVFTNLF